MNLVIPRRGVEAFKDLCKRAFPVERFGVLLGTMSNDRWSVAVGRIWTPREEEAREFCSKSRIVTPGSWWDEAQEEAADEGLMIVGDVHSHCFEGPSDGVRSETDLNRSKWWAVEGVVTVWPTRKGALRSRVCWWGSTIKVNTYTV